MLSGFEIGYQDGINNDQLIVRNFIPPAKDSSDGTAIENDHHHRLAGQKYYGMT